MTEKYESPQQRIHRDAQSIYDVLSDFNNLTPIVAGRVEGWRVEGDTCSFVVKGIPMTLHMTERRPTELIRIEAAEGGPAGFTLWVQLKEVAPRDTRMRIVLHAEMNMMIKMMIGSKIAPALEQIASRLAEAFNAV